MQKSEGQACASGEVHSMVPIQENALGLPQYPSRLMGLLQTWSVKKAVLKQDVKGHSDVKDSGWMLYSELTAWHRTRHN